MATLVNGRIDPPGFACPDGSTPEMNAKPEFLHFDGLAYMCPTDGDCTILISDWAAHMGTHEATCANAVGVSEPLVVEVPELGLAFGFLVATLMLTLLAVIDHAVTQHRAKRDKHSRQRTRSQGSLP